MATELDDLFMEDGDLMLTDDNMLEDSDTIDMTEEELTEDPEEGIEDEDDNEEDTSSENPEEEVEESKDVEDTEDVGNPLAIFAKDLKSNSDMLADIDDERLDSIESIEDLRSIFVEDLDSAKQEWIDSLDDISGGLIKHIQNGGDIKKYVEVYTEDDYSDIDVDKLKDNESLQDKVILELYKEMGITSDRAKRKLDRIIDKEEEALDSLEELQEIKAKRKQSLEEETKKQAAQRKESYDNMWRDIETNTNKVEEFLPGRKINTKVKKEVFKSIPEVWDDIVKNPTKYAHTLAYLKYYKILDGDFSKLEIQATSKATKDLSKAIENGVKSKKVKSNNTDNSLYNAILHSTKRK